jgi:Zn finger protein HypA/HybF involved in hydrogenase expression
VDQEKLAEAVGLLVKATRLMAEAIELHIEEEGRKCRHSSAINESVMGDQVRKMYCPDCQARWEIPFEEVS